MLNYAFDPTIVNPVSARVGQQVMGGIRFAGVDGAPDRPWKLDKNNYQFRVGTAYSAQREDRVPRRLRQVLPQPDESGQQRRVRPVDATSSRRTTAAARRPTRCRTPGPTGSRTPPGSSLGAETFLGRGPTFSNPDFVVPNVHQFSAGIQRELPWRISLEATYAGSRSYDLEAGFGAYNEPSAEFQAQCDVTLGGSRSFCDQLLPNPFFGVAGFEGTTRFTNPTLSRFELARPFPAFTGGIDQEPEQHRQADLRLGAVRGEQALGEGRHHQRQLHLGAAVDGRSAATIGSARLCRRVSLLERRPVLLAPQAPRHRVWRVGTALVPQRAQHRRAISSAAGRLRRCSSTRPASRGTCPATSIWRRASASTTIALPGKKEGQFIYGVKPCVGQRQANGNYDLLSVSQAYGCTEPYFLIRENFQRRTAMNRYDEFRRPVAVACST